MSLPTSMLRVLLARGVDNDTIVEMSELSDAEEAARRAEHEASEEAKREKRRESNRRRQRAWYDRHVRDNQTNAVSAETNQTNGIMGVEDVRGDEQKKVLEPKKNPSGITSSSTPTGSQVSPPAKPRRFEWPDGQFEAFWDLYPRKTNRKKSAVSFERLRRTDTVALATVMNGVQRMRDSGLVDEDACYAPHATTFLNNDRFNDIWPSRGGSRGPPAAQRLSGPTAAALARRQAQDRPDEPALDLEPAPTVRAFPSRQSGSGALPSDLAPRGDREAGGDPQGPFAAEPGTVHDLRARRAFGG